MSVIIYIYGKYYLEFSRIPRLTVYIPDCVPETAHCPVELKKEKLHLKRQSMFYETKKRSLNYSKGKTIIADKQRVQQVCMNLLSNACKFTQDGIIEVNAWVIGPDKNEKEKELMTVD